MHFRGRLSSLEGSSRCKRHLLSSDAGLLECSGARWGKNINEEHSRTELTERRSLLPTKYLFGKRGHEEEIGLVVKGWQAVVSNHAVNLFLGLVLCGWVHQHREEESLEDRDGLRARSCEYCSPYVYDPYRICSS